MDREYTSLVFLLDAPLF
ncbi:hypothetical protein Goari_026758 [Gossypium aridum]|uniref:Uncharacterized protein n=1 Tax=Gossypium aridum TaxID=34290 RepID=A0A7J8YV58_GOSAI|nr:hypothetical protein [Gossypium aridum]